jgi:hypothetical protein
MLYCYAKLSDEQLARIKAFEEETGKTVLALREIDVEAELLSREEMDRLRALEKELGLVLLVVRDATRS